MRLSLLFLSMVRYPKHILQLPNPCHVGILLKALAEHYQMSTNVLVFQPFFSFFPNISVCPNQPPAAKGPGKRVNRVMLIFI